VDVPDDQAIAKIETDIARWTAVGRANGFVRVRLRLLTHEEGGRQRGICSGYFPTWRWKHLPPGAHEMAAVVIEGHDELGPGDEATVRLYPSRFVEWTLGPGENLEMCEGGRAVGAGTLIEFCAPFGHS